MARSFLTFTSRGVGPYPLAGLDYLLTSHLSAEVNGTPVAATFDAVANTATLGAAPAAGAEVVFLRTTPRLREERLTQFLDLANGAAGLTGALLDQDYRQLMLLAGEARDVLEGLVAPATAMVMNDADQWEAEGLRIEGLADGLTPGPGAVTSDVATVGQLDAVDAAVRDLPAAVLDNDDGLMVVAGEWDDQAPSPFRTALSLGTAALLDTGTGASQVPAFLDGGIGPVERYPAADGRNIDLTNHPIQGQIEVRSLATVVRWASQANASPAQDPGVASWSQNTASRLNLSGGWAGRVELNNSGAVIGTDHRIQLVAGTWRLRWLFKPIMPLLNSATNRTSLRLTNNDDTASQIIYYDLGLHRPSVDFSDLDYSMLPDSVVLSFGSSAELVFRYSNRFSGGNNVCNFVLLVQRIDD